VVIQVLRDFWTGVGVAFGVYFAAWVLALVVIAALGIVLLISRGSPDGVRNVFRQAVASGSSRGLVHTGDRDAGPPRVGAALRDLRGADPGFDYNAFLDGARVAVGAYAVALLGSDDRLLRRITTPGFWQTHNGQAITEMIAQRQRHARNQARGANGSLLLLDVSWRQPALQSVALGERGLDRITVRLASVSVGAALPNWHRTDMATQFDWDFVRPAGRKTDPGTVVVVRACASCGAPFRSQLEDACPYCHAPRADAQAGWRLDRNYLVVESVRR
jgi:hypothetical protein